MLRATRYKWMTICYEGTMIIQKNRFQSVPIAALCYITYSVKTWFLKILSVCQRKFALRTDPSTYGETWQRKLAKKYNCNKTKKLHVSVLWRSVGRLSVDHHPNWIYLAGHVRVDSAARLQGQPQLRQEAHHRLPGCLPNQPKGYMALNFLYKPKPLPWASTAWYNPFFRPSTCWMLQSID